MQRRTFLAGAGTGLMAAPAIARTSWKTASPNDTINIAIAGIRGIGKAHYSAISKFPNVRISHVVDIDERHFTSVLPELKAQHGGDPATETDIRRILENKDVDAVSVGTPEHWHSLMTLWACQAGKDVHVEKPVSHNIWESRKVVEAARRYGRVVQSGMESRSTPIVQEAMKFLQEGGLGELYMAKALCFKPRENLGTKPDSPVPDGVHYDLWLGPAPWRPFNENRFHYNWHWYWDYGTADIGNQGAHQMDIMRWGMNKRVHPRKIHCAGGLFCTPGNMQETPNTQYATYEYDDGAILHFEVRGWMSGAEENIKIGNFFYGSKGWMVLEGRGWWRTFFGRNDEPGPSMGVDKDGKPDGSGQKKGPDAHFANFFDCMRSRNWQHLNADILEGHMSTSLCHMANISCRLGRKLEFDSHSERFIGDDQANGLLTRNYRYPYVVPEQV